MGILSCIATRGGLARVHAHITSHTCKHARGNVCSGSWLQRSLVHTSARLEAPVSRPAQQQQQQQHMRTCRTWSQLCKSPGTRPGSTMSHPYEDPSTETCILCAGTARVRPLWSCEPLVSCDLGLITPFDAKTENFCRRCTRVPRVRRLQILRRALRAERRRC